MSVNSRQAQPTSTREAHPPTSAALGSIGVVALAMALLWAGTHQLGTLYAERPAFSSLRWWGALALIGAAGFVFANALRPVDVRAKIDWSRVLALDVLPLAFLVYCWIALEFQIANSFLNTVFAWASPFGHGILAALAGIGVTAGMHTKR